jgi:hypothetical protein
VKTHRDVENFGGAGEPNEDSPPCATNLLIAGGQGRSADDVLLAACAAILPLAVGLFALLGCLCLELLSPPGTPLRSLL